MLKYEIKCDWCGKEFNREVRRMREAQKNNWRQFCSPTCLRNSRLSGKELICDNPSCNNKFYRQQKEISKVTKSFCSQSCSAIINNKYRKRNRKFKKCANRKCKHLISLNKKFCSMVCFKSCLATNKTFAVKFLSNPPLTKRIYAKRVIKALKYFVKINQRVPFKRELNIYYRPARIAFGTWNKAIQAAGFDPNQQIFTHKYTANDKHICDSLAEKIIDDWLFARKISHQRNLYYPNQKRFKTDFKVGSFWIEFFGLEGQLKRYDELKKQKLQLIKKLKLNLIEIYPGDLFPKSRLDIVLATLLH